MNTNTPLVPALGFFYWVVLHKTHTKQNWQMSSDVCSHITHYIWRLPSDVRLNEGWVCFLNNTRFCLQNCSGPWWKDWFCFRKQVLNVSKEEENRMMCSVSLRANPCSVSPVACVGVCVCVAWIISGRGLLQRTNSYKENTQWTLVDCLLLSNYNSCPVDIERNGGSADECRAHL